MPNKRLGFLVLGMVLAGCSLAPNYVKPALTTPVTGYVDMGPWTPASPNDAAPRGDWWAMYNDPTLSRLEVAIDTSNPSYAAALARYDAAMEAANEAAAAQYPLVDLNGYATQNRQSADRPLRDGQGPDNYGDNELAGSFSYELDLWGRVRNLVAAGKAQAQASGADAAAMRLSLEAQLADAYFNLRGSDAEIQLLTQTGSDYLHALQLTQTQHAGGIVSGLDVGQAQTQYDTAVAQLTDAVAQRALYLHEIASLAGVPANAFALAPDPNLPPPPPVPVAASSVLLQRRPDVAAAERRAAAANAQIGVARAAFFPSISINATGGYEAEGGGINLSNSFWSLGPELALTVFDGGERRAADRLAIDQFNEASANYKTVALTAFQQVEDNLVLCNELAIEAGQQAAAVQAAAHTQALSMVLYQDGADTYLDVVTAQAALLDTQRTALSIGTRRLQASVNLIEALGGGWRPAS
jgi:NodT family efflux transporter outer membrane factor (OMF) lipoprotein